MAVIPLPMQPKRSLTEVVAEEVRALMGRYNVNQTTLSVVMGVSQPQVSQRLRGLVPFDANEIGVIADYFNVTPAALFGAASTNPRPDGGPDGGVPMLRARRDSNPKPSDPKVRGCWIAA